MKTKLALALALLVGLMGCQPAPTLAPPTSVTNKAFRVALLLPRPVDADSFTRSGYQGLQLIQQELGAAITYTENVPEADFEKVFRQYAVENYDYIIGLGNQFAPAAEKVAADFPGLDFAVVGKYGGNNTNLGGLSLREGEMAYLFGVIAALKTQTKQVAYLGGVENASQQEIVTLYQRGAQATDPTVRVTVNFVGNFTDTVTAQQIAQADIAAGVDIIFILAGVAGEGVHAQAEQAGIFTLGWIQDLNHLAPKAVLTSNVQDFARVLLRGATLAQQGRWEGKQYKFGLADEVQALAPFYGLITPAEEAQINIVKNDLIVGKIDAAP